MKKLSESFASVLTGKHGPCILATVKFSESGLKNSHTKVTR